MKVLSGPAERVIVTNSFSSPVYVSPVNDTVGALITAGDGPSIDAFSRWRVSNPISLFDSQFTYDLAPLLYQQVTAESGAAITHDTTNRIANLAFSSTPVNGTCYMQSYEHVRYQPGNGHLIFVTYNLRGQEAGATKFAGYGVHGVNGIFFEALPDRLQWAIHSDTDQGDNAVTQANWNIDKLDGSGVSGLTLDATKTHISVIDLQALYVGRVRVGFDINGVIYYVHEFLHANTALAPYIQTANLPIACGMKATGTTSATMCFICASVKSEGGADEVSGYTFAAAANVTAASGARTHLLSVRPRLTFNSIANRARFELDSVDVAVVGGSNPVFWELVIGQASTGDWANVNETYSAFESQAAAAATLVGNPAIVLDAGYVAATAQSKSSASFKIANRYPITLDVAGAHRALGTLTLLVTGIGGTAVTRTVLNWRELR